MIELLLSFILLTFTLCVLFNKIKISVKDNYLKLIILFIILSLSFIFISYIHNIDYIYILLLLVLIISGYFIATTYTKNKMIKWSAFFAFPSSVILILIHLIINEISNSLYGITFICAVLILMSYK